MPMEFRFARMGSCSPRFLSEKLLLTTIVGYQLFSGLILAFFSIDFMIPCLFKTVLHVECWGCGLSRAAIDVVLLNWGEAYRRNPIIFLVLAIAIFLSRNRLKRDLTEKKSFISFIEFIFN